MPSSSARCSQLPRCVDKLPFYVALHKLRDHLRGDLPNLDDNEVTFPDLELKVEPKKEKLGAEVKHEMTDSETTTHPMPKQQASLSTFQLTVEIKTEDSSVAGKQRKSRRKRLSTVGSSRKESSVPNSLSGTVCSPYFQPWQQPSSYFAVSIPARNGMTIANTTEQVKQETPIDFRQYGCMPEDLSVAGSRSNLPDAHSRFF